VNVGDRDHLAVSLGLILEIVLLRGFSGRVRGHGHGHGHAGVGRIGIFLIIVDVVCCSPPAAARYSIE
jgi:hypothetical protein